MVVQPGCCQGLFWELLGIQDHHAAAIQAVEAVDLQIARLLPVIESLGGALVVTADHGNADCMFDQDKATGEPKRDADGRILAKTSHTLNPVPLHVFAPSSPLVVDPAVNRPGLANVAATVLHLMGYRAPEGYEPSLLSG